MTEPPTELLDAIRKAVNEARIGGSQDQAKRLLGKVHAGLNCATLGTILNVADLLVDAHSPPMCDGEAEEAVLAILLYAPDSSAWVLDKMEVRWFLMPRNRKAFQAMRELRARGVSLDDSAAVVDEMRRSKAMTDAAWVPWLCSIVENAPPPSNLKYYAGRVRASWARSEVLAATNALQKAVITSEPTNEIRRAFDVAKDRIDKALYDRKKTNDPKKSRTPQGNGVAGGRLPAENGSDGDKG